MNHPFKTCRVSFAPGAHVLTASAQSFSENRTLSALGSTWLDSELLLARPPAPFTPLRRVCTRPAAGGLKPSTKFSGRSAGLGDGADSSIEDRSLSLTFERTEERGVVRSIRKAMMMSFQTALTDRGAVGDALLEGDIGLSPEVLKLSSDLADAIDSGYIGLRRGPYST